MKNYLATKTVNSNEVIDSAIELLNSVTKMLTPVNGYREPGHIDTVIEGLTQIRNQVKAKMVA